MMKRFPTLRSGDDVLRTVREQVAHFCPEHSSLVNIANLTDDGAFLHGGLTPMVRKPVGRLPSGAAVMGMGDCVTVVDPLCGNGLNNAAVMAKLLSERIADHGRERFDENWMNRVFDEFWSYGSDVYVFMRALLEQPERLVKAIGAIPQCEALAADIINGYPDPQGFARWMKDDASSKAHLDLRLQSAA